MRNFSWQLDQDSSESTEFNTQTVGFGDGYEQAVSFGINNARKSWSASVTNTKAAVDEIYRFLLSTKNVEPFTIKPIADEPAITARCDGEITRAHLGGMAWRISFNLRQVF